MPSMLHMSYRVPDYYLTQFFTPVCVSCSASLLQRLSSRDCPHSGLIQDTDFWECFCSRVIASWGIKELLVSVKNTASIARS